MKSFLQKVATPGITTSNSLITMKGPVMFQWNYTIGIHVT